MAYYEPSHPDLRCMQIKLFSSLVLKGLRPMGIMGTLPSFKLKLTCMKVQDDWMDNSQFYLLFNSISVISG